jgi:murein DD-endopeptidase MepM/ murein hydrolase activator NlpD
MTTGPAAGAASSRYTVREGDTLTGLSRQYGVPVVELAQSNSMPADAQLRTGQTLQLPAGIWSAEKRIRVTRPATSASVRSPVVVEGTAATFESAIVVELLDPTAAAPLAQATVRVANADVGLHGPFKTELAVPAGSAARSVIIRVYWTSPRDGSPLDEVRVPVTLAPAG